MQLTAEAEARIFGTPEADPAPTPAEGGKTPEPAPESAPVPTPQATELFNAIKAERDAKEARAKTEAERESLRKRAEDAEARVQEILKAKEEMILDPVAYLKTQGYSDQDIALHGEAIMYSLMPDKAPEGLRGRLVEAQVKRDKARQAEEAKAKEAQARVEAQTRLEGMYQEQLAVAASSTPPGTFPDSEAWFGQDKDAYVKSLYHTARNLSDAADRAGAQVDLSPQAVAKALELDLNVRLKRVRGVSAQQAPQKQATEVAPPEQKPEPSLPTGKEIPATKVVANLTKPLTDKERLDRAVAAAFKRPE